MGIRISDVDSQVETYIEKLAEHLDSEFAFALDGHLQVNVEPVDDLVLLIAKRHGENMIYDFRDEFIKIITASGFGEELAADILKLPRKNGTV